jgi:hypothetical protein
MDNERPYLSDLEPAAIELRAVDGRVSCPRLGPTVVERCRECDYLLRIEDRDGLRVACSVSRFALEDWVA